MDFNTGTNYFRNIKCQDVYTESQVDYVLPDYLGDVRKILFTDATLKPSGRFAGGEEVEFSGIVVYNLVYLDSEGELRSVEFTSDYDYSVKCNSDSYNDSVADTRVSNYAIRLVGPRKISAKVSLVGSVRLTENYCISTSGDAFDGGAPEIKMGSVKIRRSRPSSVAEREYAESVARLDGAILDEVSVVYSCAEATIDSVQPDEDSAVLKGRLRLWAVIKNGDEPAYGVEKLVDFEEKIDFEGISSAMSLIPDASVSSVKANVNADENGCEVVLSVIAELCLIGEENQNVELVLDGYLLDSPTENSYEEFAYTSLVDYVSVKNSHETEIERASLECEGLREVVFLTATPKVESVEEVDGVATISGEVRYSGVASELVGEKTGYTGIKFSAPFSTNVNINCQNSENLQLESSLRATNVSATVDQEKMYVSCCLDCALVVTKEEKTHILSEMNRCGECSEDKEARITVYYPTPGESLFEVSKRFRASMNKVAKDNDITESVFSSDNPSGSLSGVKRLIIY